jgi:predicted Fe-Mo cluster-binding NifX family protein
MKVAVPVRDGLVDEHFGHCEHFMVYSLDEENTVVGEQKVDSSEGCGCKSNIASILAQMGVTTMVAGNMGQGAVQVLQARGIRVIRGASGRAREVAERFAAGEVADSSVACAGHGHGHAQGEDCGHSG